MWYKTDIGLLVKSFLIPLTTYTMAPDFDGPMDGEGEGQKSLPPLRSPAMRERSASPRAQERSSRRSGPRDWMYSPMIDCVTHRGSECLTCGMYTLHLITTLMEEDPSYIAAVKKK
jgi:hypothetical protein